jgi:hypothetical protein
LWSLISKVSQVFEPSPQGVFRVVILSVWVGRRTGPLTRRSLLLERSMSSWQTFSREATFRLVRVILILWVFYGGKCQCALGKNQNPLSIPSGDRDWETANIQGLRQTLSPAFGKTLLDWVLHDSERSCHGKVMKAESVDGNLIWSLVGCLNFFDIHKFILCGIR